MRGGVTYVLGARAARESCFAANSSAYLAAPSGLMRILRATAMPKERGRICEPSYAEAAST